MPQYARKGFTLIELLVVVTLIGILAAFVLVIMNPDAAAGRTRDSQRISALKSIQVALDLYQADKRSYPTEDIIGNDITAPTAVTVLIPYLEEDGKYIDSMPIDPKTGDRADLGCSYMSGVLITARNFYYMPKNSGEGYYLFSVLENSSASKPCDTTVTGEGCYCIGN